MSSGKKHTKTRIKAIHDSLEILFENARANLEFLKHTGASSIQGEITIEDVGAARLSISLAKLEPEGAPADAYDPFCVAGLFNVLDIDDLELSEDAEAAAKILKEAHPGQIVFTSGRRDVSEQAAAMAQNVVTNRKWIEQTYANTAERRELQTWVDDNPDATTKTEIAAGLKSIMDTWSDASLRRISRHLTGDAFDVAPVAGDAGERIKATMKSLPKLHRVLFWEGGKEIWHAQF